MLQLTECLDKFLDFAAQMLGKSLGTGGLMLEGLAPSLCVEVCLTWRGAYGWGGPCETPQGHKKGFQTPTIGAPRACSVASSLFSSFDPHDSSIALEFVPSHVGIRGCRVSAWRSGVLP